MKTHPAFHIYLKGGNTNIKVKTPKNQKFFELSEIQEAVEGYFEIYPACPTQKLMEFLFNPEKLPRLTKLEPLENPKDYKILVNEEGAINGSRINPLLTEAMSHPIFGNVLIVHKSQLW